MRPPVIRVLEEPLWIALLFVLFGLLGVMSGRRYAAARGDGWQEGRAQLIKWLDLLRQKERPDNVFEIIQNPHDGDDVSYRLLPANDCWAMAMFKTCKLHKDPKDFRIRELSAITVTHQPDGTFTACVDGKVIPKVRAA